METHISRFVECFGGPESADLDADTAYLWETWHFISRFLALVWVSQFIRKDYDTPELDHEVNDFLYGKINQGNECLDLAAKLADFLRDKPGYSNDCFKELFDLDYQDFKTLVSTASIVKDEQGVVRQVMSAKLRLIADRLSFFRDSSFVVKYNKKASLTGDSLGLPKGKYILGPPYLALNSGQRLPEPLFPFFLLLKDETAQVRSLTFSHWTDHLNIAVCFQEVRPLPSAEKAGGQALIRLSPDLIALDHPYVVNSFAEVHANTTEAPIFDHVYHPADLSLTIKLRYGNILNLESLARKDKANKYAVVLVPSSDKNIQTTMIKQLETVGERACIEHLLQNPMQEGRVYASRPCRLPFQQLLFCPIYSIEQNRRPDLDIIRQAIASILDHLQEHTNITSLACPALGAYWGDELRKAVPDLWMQAIQERRESLALKEIIFSFIEPATMNAYRKAFDKLTGTRQLINLERIECEIAKKKKEIERLEKQRSEAEQLVDKSPEKFASSALPTPLTKFERFYGENESECYEHRQCVEDSLNCSLVYLRLFLCIFMGIGLHLKIKARGAGCKKLTKSLQELHKAVLGDRDKKVAINHIPHFEHGILMHFVNSIFSDIYKDLKKEWNDYADQYGMILNFLNPVDAKTIANIRNKIQHNYEEKSSAYYAEHVDTVKQINLKNIIFSSFFMDKNFYELICVAEFDGTDNLENRNEVKVFYDSLCGNRLTPLRNKILLDDSTRVSLKKKRVYLRKVKKTMHNDKLDILTSMHPFILYQHCPQCTKLGLFVWAGFDVEQPDAPVFKSDSCSHDYSPNTSKICLKTYDNIKGDFWNAFDKLGKDAG
jgi:hypothetical protein